MAFATLSAPSATPDRMAARMEKFVIEGGAPLSGSIVPAGNKNAALPALAACLLTEERVVVRNVPRIRDVDAMIGLLKGLGVETKWLEDNAVELSFSVNHDYFQGSIKLLKDRQDKSFELLRLALNEAKFVPDATVRVREQVLAALDLTGVVCPMNWVRARLELERMRPGESLELVLDPGDSHHIK